MNALLRHQWGKSPAQDRVWAQVAGLGPRRGVRRLLMALEYQAFVDESQSSEEFILGGYIQTAEIWAQFVKDWEQLLPLGTIAKNGKYHFHMTEMAYYGKMQEVQKFYSIIEKHNLIPISLRMNMGDFHRALERTKKFCNVNDWSVDWGLWSNPYYFCFRILLLEFHLQRHVFEEAISLTEKIDFYFDNRSESPPIYAAWNEIRQKMPKEAEKYFGANPRFENDQDFLGLQAADLWAWWIRTWYEEDASDHPDKMKNFDFGNWRGKKVKTIRFCISENAIFDRYRGMAIENYVEGNVDPMTLSRLLGES